VALGEIVKERSRPAIEPRAEHFIQQIQRLAERNDNG